PAGQEVVRAHVLFAPRGPVPDPEQHQEVPGDHDHIEQVEVAHGEVSGGWWRLWRLVKVEEVLDGEVGEAPQLHVRAGAVARGDQAAVLDGVAPQLRVPQAGAVHRGQDAVERTGQCGMRNAECGID